MVKTEICSFLSHCGIWAQNYHGPARMNFSVLFFHQEGSENEEEEREEEEEENTDYLTDSNKENETDEENNVRYLCNN